MEMVIFKTFFGEYKFEISTMSFYQVNPIQTEKMYNLAISQAGLNKNDVILDLYCGIGTIGIFASSKVRQVYGMEIIEAAIQNAKNNAKLNNIKNAEFTVGDVGKSSNELLNKNIDAVFIDPPRRGLEKTVVDNLINAKIKKIIYISCNPATLMRDLSYLEKFYDILRITPIDLFPFTRTCRNDCNITNKKIGHLIKNYVQFIS